MSLPSIKQLFIDSWQLLKQVLLNLFILGLINFGLILGIGLIAVILAMLFGVGATFSGGGNPLSDPAKLIPFITSLGLVMIIAWIAIVSVSLAVQVTTILILNKASEKSSVSSVFGLFKQSFRYILPLIGISLVIWLLTVGGFFLLIIPAFIITVLLAFSAYELILNNQSGLNSLRRSFYIVASNFWGILGRIALLWLIAIVVSLALSLLDPSKDSEVSGLFALIQFIFNIFFGWFSACYTFALYKQARATVSETETRRLTPLVITAIIGWIIGAFVIFASFKTFSQIIESTSKQQRFMPAVSPLPYGEDQMPTEREIEQRLREATQSSNFTI